jgi:hypothetical protein
MQRLTAQPHSSVDDYLHRLRQCLRDVPPAERERLLEPARARIELEVGPAALIAEDGPALQRALRELGEPETLARWLRSHIPVEEHHEAASGRLRACRACRREVSVEANTCPHCGAPFPARQTWRGWGFEWKSRQSLWGLPLVHVAFGRDARGKLRVARGIIAIGQFAVGGITIAQFGLGAIFALGQFVAAPIAIGQAGIGLLLGLGQIATGHLAVGQIALGTWVRAQVGVGAHVWSMHHAAPEAVEFFRRLFGR